MIKRIIQASFCFTLAAFIGGCTANVDDPKGEVDQTANQDNDDDECVTSCDSTKTDCVAECDDDECEVSCTTEYDDCVAECD